MIINKSLLAIAFATALSACSQPTAGTEQTAALSTQNAQETQHAAHAHHDTSMPMARCDDGSCHQSSCRCRFR